MKPASEADFVVVVKEVMFPGLSQSTEGVNIESCNATGTQSGVEEGKEAQIDTGNVCSDAEILIGMCQFLPLAEAKGQLQPGYV